MQNTCVKPSVPLTQTVSCLQPDNAMSVLFFHGSAGDVALLNCTAVVNTSNESLNDKNPVSDSIHQLAGPELRDELLKLKGGVQRSVSRVFSWRCSKMCRFCPPSAEQSFLLARLRAGCRTGEAKLTKGFNLAARFIIHTVGPKYKSKYRTAAESSLYSCYRNIMQLVV